VAGDWIKFKLGIERELKFVVACHQLELTTTTVLGALMRVAEWFNRYGENGRMKAPPSLIDRYLEMPGLGAMMVSLGYLREHSDGTWSLHKFVQPARKKISTKQRRELIEAHGGCCAHCQGTDRLEIDHILPVSAGGRSNIENLQVLCFTCNREKGRTVPEECRG
jgi:5-methylcytosine-specific restriction endonuclease McrA